MNIQIGMKSHFNEIRTPGDFIVSWKSAIESKIVNRKSCSIVNRKVFLLKYRLDRTLSI